MDQSVNMMASAEQNHVHTDLNYTQSSSDIKLGVHVPARFGSTRHQYRDRQKRMNVDFDANIVQEYFNKKFCFQNNGCWQLPSPEEMFTSCMWKIPKLYELKEQLNRVKNKLNDYNLDDWHKHTRAMNKAKDILRKLRNEYDPEFVTQAWCKFYENVMTFPLVPVDIKKKLNSVHLCEAPGAFITSLNHYLQLHYPDIEWQWKATTLNPYYEGNPLSNMINDDKFILQTLKNWCFGKDYTGDLMNLQNMLYLVTESSKMGDVFLVTADGSIDCQENPGEQESVVSRLHYCEAVTALHILSKGGSFLIKIFTMYEAETICLLYFLNNAFKQVNVFKPATSKEGNSEVYVVCLEYKGKEVMEPWLERLRQNFGPESNSEAMFSLASIPENFIEQVMSCAKMFKNFQVEVIENNIMTYRRKPYRDYTIKHIQFLIADHFFKHYKMEKLPDETQEVVGKKKLKETVTLNLDPREESFSYNEKCVIKTLTPLERLSLLRKELENMKIHWPFDTDIKWLQFPAKATNFRIYTGKPVSIVHSSKFCLGRLLKIRNEMQKLAFEIKPASSYISEHSRSNPNTSSKISDPLVNILQENEPNLGNVRKLNFKEDLWSSMKGGWNEKAEKEAFFTIVDEVEDMWRDENLFLQGYPMLTQFNVGVVYLLSHLFKKVGFIRPVKQDFAIIFVGFCSWKLPIMKFLIEVADEVDYLEKNGGKESVLALLQVDHLCGSNTSIGDYNSQFETVPEGREFNPEETAIFYKCVTEVNHLCIKEQVLDILKTDQ